MGPTTAHWDSLQHLVGYLRFKSNKGILISKPIETSIYCYVDVNGSGEASRSKNVYILFNGSNPVAWKSKQKAMVASSTAQDEYIEQYFAAQECSFISHLFAPILEMPIPTFLSENKTAIGVSADFIS
ncbi:hypothetical protein O181_087160 [Austropuccinia psidii MF-1]|uniref:Uncharacterized protein n=1 Tax=Austropuccinia psidii MF-1 TaxID=1389203 RepID=A0A9Q3P1C8_9BASI|nr:hypothetical protein [Austropuccinia psidii MF-1]